MVPTSRVCCRQECIPKCACRSCQCSRVCSGVNELRSWRGRGVVRQLGTPALLAATYRGDAAAIAAAAMEELETVLVDSLSQLERLAVSAGALPFLSCSITSAVSLNAAIVCRHLRQQDP